VTAIGLGDRWDGGEDGEGTVRNEWLPDPWLHPHGDKEAKMDPSGGGKGQGRGVCRRVWSWGQRLWGLGHPVDTPNSPGELGPNPMAWPVLGPLPRPLKASETFADKYCILEDSVCWPLDRAPPRMQVWGYLHLPPSVAPWHR